jgi:hypothetical protein
VCGSGDRVNPLGSQDVQPRRLTGALIYLKHPHARSGFTFFSELVLIATLKGLEICASFTA